MQRESSWRKLNGCSSEHMDDRKVKQPYCWYGGSLSSLDRRSDQPRSLKPKPNAEQDPYSLQFCEGWEVRKLQKWFVRLKERRHLCNITVPGDTVHRAEALAQFMRDGPAVNSRRSVQAMRQPLRTFMILGKRFKYQNTQPSWTTLRGSKYSGGISCRCGGNSKRTSSGAWRCGWIAAISWSNLKRRFSLWIDMEVVSWDGIHSCEDVKTAEMTTKDLDYDLNFVDKTGLRGPTPILKEVLLWARCCPAALQASEKLFTKVSHCSQPHWCLILRNCCSHHPVGQLISAEARPSTSKQRRTLWRPRWWLEC